jgi:hypothetical protein
MKLNRGRAMAPASHDFWCGGATGWQVFIRLILLQCERY